MKIKNVLIPFVAIMFPLVAMATPSSTLWAPSTATCQAYAVPHVTYDSYFAGNGGYPTDVGLTSGLISSDKIQAEAGFDLLYPTHDPLYLNGKFCIPEKTLFKDAPALSFGIYDMGMKPGVTNYNVLNLIGQKSLPFGGYVAIGGYHGLNKSLMTNSEGKSVQKGMIAAIASPDIDIGLTGLKKINFVADIQTGKNVLGGWGVGSYVYFTDNISLLTGPIYYFDKALQPNASQSLWTMQLDIDIPLDKEKGK